MLKLIVGNKGSGKTKTLVDDLNKMAQNEEKNVVCIERGRRLDRFVKYHIRLIDINEYPVQGFEQLLAFLAGINAKDYDLTHLYIDSIFKVANTETNYQDLAEFCAALDQLAIDKNFEASIILSADPANLPKSLSRFIEAPEEDENEEE